MPAILICLKDDGRITVSAMPEPPPGYEEGAVEAASLDEATDLAKEVLGEAGPGDAGLGSLGERHGRDDSEAGGEFPAGDPADEEDSAMGSGWDRAKRGR